MNKTLAWVMVALVIALLWARSGAAGMAEQAKDSDSELPPLTGGSLNDAGLNLPGPNEYGDFNAIYGPNNFTASTTGGATPACDYCGTVSYSQDYGGLMEQAAAFAAALTPKTQRNIIPLALARPAEQFGSQRSVPVNFTVPATQPYYNQGGIFTWRQAPPSIPFFGRNF
jgi:hypothetical protein